MADDSSDSQAAWIPDGPRRRDHPSISPQLETVPDSGSDTLTVVPVDAEYADVTTAWITVDEEAVVDVAEMH